MMRLNNISFIRSLLSCGSEEMWECRDVLWRYGKESWRQKLTPLPRNVERNVAKVLLIDYITQVMPVSSVNVPVLPFFQCCAVSIS